MNPRRTVDPSELLTHAAGVRALAHALVRDSHSADDVVQETWRVALERGAPNDAPLAAWLAGIVRRVAHGFGRGEARRRTREQSSARDEATPSTAELCERAALHRQLVEAVLELDEPTRSTILLRYFESLPPREIAIRQSASLDAVKSRLARGLAQLRKRMALDDERNSSAWLALLGLRAPRAVELTRPNLLGVAVKASSSLVASLAGMAVVVAVCAIWLIARQSGSSSRPALASARVPNESTSLATTDGAHLTLGEPAVALESNAQAAAAGADTPASDDRRLQGRVVDEAGRPIAGAQVSLQFDLHRGHFFGIGDPARGIRQVETVVADAGGEFAVHAEADQRYLLIVSANGFGQRRIFDCSFGDSEVVVVLTRACALSGTITHAISGEPVSNAMVSVIYRDASFRSWTRETTSDARGRYGLNDLECGSLEVTVDATDLEPLYFQPIELAAGGSALRDYALNEGAVVAGRVIDALSGQPIQGARVGIDWTFRNAVDTGATGTFRLLGAPTDQGILRIAAEAHGHAAELFQLRSDELAQVEIALRTEHRATGRALDAAGRPAAGVEVHAFGGNDCLGVVTSPDGRFELTGLAPDNRHVLLLVKPGCAERVIDFPVSELERASVDFGDIALRLPSAVVGRVLDSQGEPVAGATVQIDGCNSDRAALALQEVNGGEFRFAHREYRTDSSGRFVCTDLASGSYWLGASHNGFANGAQATLWLGSETTSEVELKFAPGQRMRGRVVDNSGAPVGNLRVTLYSSTDEFYSLCSVRSSADGGFDFVGLPEGECSVEIESWNTWDGRDIPQYQWDYISTSATDLVLTVPETAYISGVVFGADDQPSQHQPIVQVKPLDGLGGRLARTQADAHGRFRLRIWKGAAINLHAYVQGVSEGKLESQLSELGELDNVAAGASDVVIRMRTLR